MKLLAYFEIEEIAEKSGLSKDQILRLGMSGTIIFSILEHAPSNYEEVNEIDMEDGTRAVSTKTNETMEYVGEKGPALKLKYLSPEDVINVVTNDAPNRKTLVRALYETRELDPKKGKWFVNKPWRASLADLVVSREEWELFSKGKGKQIRKYLPLPKPEEITIPWLFKNLSIGTWLASVGIAVSLFGGGIYIGQTELYQSVTDFLKPSATTKSAPNKALQPTAKSGG